jgi:hypothetical protein
VAPSPARIPLLIETLLVADAAYGTILEIQKLAVDGRQSDALHLLALLAEGVASHRPILRDVLAAERQAAEVRDASERTASTIGRIIRRPTQEHFHAANDHRPAPEQPSPSVA